MSPQIVFSIVFLEAVHETAETAVTEKIRQVKTAANFKMIFFFVVIDSSLFHY